MIRNKQKNGPIFDCIIVSKNRRNPMLRSLINLVWFCRSGIVRGCSRKHPRRFRCFFRFSRPLIGTHARMHTHTHARTHVHTQAPAVAIHLRCCVHRVCVCVFVFTVTVTVTFAMQAVGPPPPRPVGHTTMLYLLCLSKVPKGQ